MKKKTKAKLKVVGAESASPETDYPVIKFCVTSRDNSGNDFATLLSCPFDAQDLFHDLMSHPRDIKIEVEIMPASELDADAREHINGCSANHQHGSKKKNVAASNKTTKRRRE